MADLININQNVPLGQEFINALKLISQGIGTLERLDGQRAQAIGAGQAIMQTKFGASTAAEAQAQSDRWSAFLAGLDDPDNAPLRLLTDLIDATFYQ